MTRWERKRKERGSWKQSHTITTIPTVKASTSLTIPMARAILRSAYSWAPGPMPMIGGSTSGRKRSGVSTGIVPPNSDSGFGRRPASRATCWQAYSSSYQRGSGGRVSLTGGMPPIACCNFAAVQAGMCFVRSSPIARWETSSSPNGPTHSGISGISGWSCPLQTNDAGLIWSGPAAGS